MFIVIRKNNPKLICNNKPTETWNWRKCRWKRPSHLISLPAQDFGVRFYYIVSIVGLLRKLCPSLLDLNITTVIHGFYDFLA